MVYDWDGQRTRRTQVMRFTVAVTVGLTVPLVITMWSYVSGTAAGFPVTLG